MSCLLSATSTVIVIVAAPSGPTPSSTIRVFCFKLIPSFTEPSVLAVPRLEEIQRRLLGNRASQRADSTTALIPVQDIGSLNGSYRSSNTGLTHESHQIPERRLLLFHRLSSGATSVL